MDKHERLRKRADLQITKWGQPAFLRRDGSDRAVRVVEDAYSTREIDGRVVLQGDRRFLVSALDSTGSTIDPPDEMQDVLIIADPQRGTDSLELRIVMPPARLAPGPIVIYYELQCRDL